MYLRLGVTVAPNNSNVRIHHTNGGDFVGIKDASTSAAGFRLTTPAYLPMHFSASFLSVLAACLAVGVKATPVTSPEADLNARTTIFSGDGQNRCIYFSTTD
jgi:hypothetical protein